MVQEASQPWRTFIAQTVIAALLSAGIIGAFVQYAIDRAEFKREWQERALSEVVGPVVMHLERTKRVSARYSRGPFSYFDAKIMRDSNQEVLKILLAKGHLIPEDLLEDSYRLIEHYDVWLRRFAERERAVQPSLDDSFDVGKLDSKVDFPEDATDAFRHKYKELRGELYGDQAS